MRGIGGNAFNLFHVSPCKWDFSPISSGRGLSLAVCFLSCCFVRIHTEDPGRGILVGISSGGKLGVGARSFHFLLLECLVDN